MEVSLLDLVDKINQEQENAECAVLESMAAVYTKSFMIMEQTNDTSEFELFMESDDDKDKDEDSVSRSRSQSVGAKFIRFLKRIWQQILTMVKRFSVDKKVKKYRKLIEHYQTIPVVGGINDDFLDTQCTVMKMIIDSDITKTDDIIKVFIDSNLMTKTTNACKKIHGEWNKINEKNKNTAAPITGHVNCRTMCDWIDTTLKYYDLFFIIAKNVDKYLDSNGQNADLEIMKDKSIDLKELNNVSSIIFEQLRDNLSNFKDIIDILLKLVQPKPAQVQVDDLTMSAFNRLMNGFLHSASAGSVQGGYVFNENTHVGEAKNIMKSLEQIPEYAHAIKPIPSYEHKVIVTTYAANSEKKWLRKFYVIHCKTIDPKVEKMANEGTVIKL